MLTPFEFGVKIAAELGTAGASLPPTYSSLSTGNSTNVPPGGYTGKKAVPIRNAARPRTMTNAINPAVAEAANRAAGNESFPSNASFGPTRILGPAPLGGNPVTDPHSAERNINQVGQAELQGQPQSALTSYSAQDWWPAIRKR